MLPLIVRLSFLQEFVVQHDENANPPTFFLTLESLLNQMEKNDNEVNISNSSHPHTHSNTQQTHRNISFERSPLRKASILR